MKAAARIWPVLRREWFGGRFVACLLLLAFTVQSYITQTHIDGWAPVGGEHRAVVALSQAPSHSNAPFDHNRADCPFCQAITHAGAFFAPAPPIWILPVAWIGEASLTPLTQAIGRQLAHSWRSRAPPQR